MCVWCGWWLAAHSATGAVLCAGAVSHWQGFAVSWDLGVYAGALSERTPHVTINAA